MKLFEDCSNYVKQIHRTLIAVPVVNVFGFISLSRYLPDRINLNRSFPISPKGSLAVRRSNALLEEIVTKCDCGIDLHRYYPPPYLPHV